MITEVENYWGEIEGTQAEQVMETAEALGRQVDGLWLTTASILDDDPLPGEGSNEDEDGDLMDEDEDEDGSGEVVDFSSVAFSQLDSLQLPLIAPLPL